MAALPARGRTEVGCKGVPPLSVRASVSSPPAEPRLPTGVADDWGYDRDLECLKCGYNLRMLRVPRCPECGDVFRWQQMLQVTCPRCAAALGDVDGPNCPSCGLDLDWTALLSSASSVNLDFYEYTRNPWRQARRLILSVLMPRRFWKRIPLEAPPVVGRLGALLLALVAIAALGVLLPPVVLLRQRYMENWREWWVACAVGFTLPLVTLLLLPRFTPTLGRFRIRGGQMLRCAAYAAVPLAWMGFALFLVSAAVFALNEIALSGLPAGPWIARVPPYRMSPMLTLGELRFALDGGLFARAVGLTQAVDMSLNLLLALCLLAFGVVLTWRFWYVTLRHYLRVDRFNTWALLVSTQVIGLLVMLLALVRYRPFLYWVAQWMA